LLIEMRSLDTLTPLFSSKQHGHSISYAGGEYEM
jgi:hypothetical protein